MEQHIEAEYSTRFSKMTSLDHVSPPECVDANFPIAGEETIMSLQDYCSLITKLEILGESSPDLPLEHEEISSGLSGQSKLLYQCLVCGVVFDNFNVILYDHIQMHCLSDLLEALQTNSQCDEPSGTQRRAEESKETPVDLCLEIDLNMNTVDSPATVNTETGGDWGDINVDYTESVFPSVANAGTPTAANFPEAAPFEEAETIAPNGSTVAFGHLSNSSILTSSVNGEPGTVESETKGEKLIECSLCGKRYFTLVELKVHEYEHEFRCEICGKVFMRSELLIAHRSLHSIERPHGCEFCSDVFRSLRQLRKHMADIHNTVTPYKCHVCGETFRKTSDLFSHKKNHDNGKMCDNRRLYRCDICQKSFTSRHGKTKHEKLHDLGIHPCIQCKERFTKLEDLVAHKNSRHPEAWKPYKCEMCPNAYHEERYLRLHVLGTHRDKEESYRCRICGQMFHKERDWLAHRRSHGLKRSQFECHYCDQVFDRLQFVLRHEEIHRCNNDQPLREYSGSVGK